MLRRDLLWALDPVCFAREALGFHPDSTQKRVLRSTKLRLLLNCTRQWGKSTSAAALALHRALYYPNSLILLVSPSQRQSSELFRKVAAFLNQLAIKPAKLEDNQFSLQLANGSRIVALPGKEATVRGFSGVTLIIEDEASRVDDSLYRSLRPMLAVSGGRLILMSTPWGSRGHFFEEWSNGGISWERIECKASDCPRIPQHFLDEERASLGEWWFRQEYLCEFVETVDTVFSRDLVMSAISADVKPLF
jgi:Terminase large subunit, T4likevirus-type, N-terminal